MDIICEYRWPSSHVIPDIFAVSGGGGPMGNPLPRRYSASPGTYCWLIASRWYYSYKRRGCEVPIMKGYTLSLSRTYIKGIKVYLARKGFVESKGVKGNSTREPGCQM